MDKNQALAAFAALSQETRLDALRLLVAAGPKGLAAGEIAERLGVRQNTMSANLAILDRAGLVTSRREGRSVRYFASLESLRDVVGFLMEDCCGGRPELCAPLLDEVLGAA
ncbi:MAG: metalloregulator ArsR/SmtB family transcription factor [Rhodospirillales bacterium]|nr:metalloregulator ArsR/SmtB family transcription factor [Rhodospirillales bacterium]